MAKLEQYITAGNDFDALAQNAALTSGGLFVLPPSGSALVCARLKKLQFKTLGAVGNWIFAQRLMETGALTYDNLTVAFNVGATALGTLSGNTGLVVNDAPAAPNGVLTLGNLTGPFQNNEPIVDDGGVPGAADANGTVAFDSVEIDDGNENDYELTFADDEGLVAIDPNGAVDGTPCPILFTTNGMVLAGCAIVEFDYTRINGA